MEIVKIYFRTLKKPIAVNLKVLFKNSKKEKRKEKEKNNLKETAYLFVLLCY